MKLGKTVLMSLVAVSLTSAPVFAQAAESSSNAISRTGAEMNDGDAFAGSTMLVVVVVIVGLLAGLLLIDGGSDTPVSP